ncbi:MAG: hypothetical protein IKB86_01880 [Clostridia bacterium]|nr:hypothetical protein [Clostridia bacterium]
MDRFEQTIRRKDENQASKDKMKYHFCFALSIASGLYAIIAFVGIFGALLRSQIPTFANLIPFAVSLAIAIFFFIKKDDMVVEFDYALEDDRLIIAKIRNLSSRKEVLNLPASALKRLEAYSYAAFASTDAKKTNCSLNSDEEKYMLFFEQDSELNVLVFEPNESLRSAIKKELNR